MPARKPATPRHAPGLAERVAALEVQVAALTPAAPAAPTTTPRQAERLWVLDTLRRQLPADSGGVVYGGIARAADGSELQWQIGRAQADVLAEDWADLAPRLAALGHPVRLLLVKALLGGVHSVQALAALPGLGTTGQLYHHLRELEAAGWAHAAQRGQYAVPPARVVPLLALLVACRQ